VYYFLKNEFKNLLFVNIGLNQSGTPLDAITVKANNYPYIIACGESVNQISHYYIEIEKHLIRVRKFLSVLSRY
jgi:hypothetical protein